MPGDVSVAGGTALDSPAGTNRLLTIAAIDARRGSTQAATTGPGTEFLDLFAGGDSNGNHVESRLGQRHIYTAAAMKSPYNIPYKAFEWKVKATQCGCPVVRYERWDHCWTPTCGRNWRKDDAKSGMLVSGGV
jgi:hypothetical protein